LRGVRGFWVLFQSLLELLLEALVGAAGGDVPLGGCPDRFGDGDLFGAGEAFISAASSLGRRRIITFV
jgi:hypothetical protein